MLVGTTLFAAANTLCLLLCLLLLHIFVHYVFRIVARVCCLCLGSRMRVAIAIVADGDECIAFVFLQITCLYKQIEKRGI